MALLDNEKYSLFYQRINLIYQRPEVKASLEVILSVFTVTILIFAAIRPTLTNVASLQKKIEDLDSLNVKSDKKIAQIFEAQTDLDTFQEKLYLYDDAVPHGFSYQNMAGRIELLAKNRGLTIQTISIPGTRLFGNGKPAGVWAEKLVSKNQNNIVQTTITFTVNGDPGSVKRFLIELENLDRLAVLTSVVLTTEPGPIKGVSTLKASGQVYFYFYQPT